VFCDTRQLAASAEAWAGPVESPPKTKDNSKAPWQDASYGHKEMPRSDEECVYSGSSRSTIPCK